jgi:hypothetical protein
MASKWTGWDQLLFDLALSAEDPEGWALVQSEDVFLPGDPSTAERYGEYIPGATAITASGTFAPAAADGQGTEWV